MFQNKPPCAFSREASSYISGTYQLSILQSVLENIVLSCGKEMLLTHIFSFFNIQSVSSVIGGWLGLVSFGEDLHWPELGLVVRDSVQSQALLTAKVKITFNRTRRNTHPLPISLVVYSRVRTMSQKRSPCKSTQTALSPFSNACFRVFTAKQTRLHQAVLLNDINLSNLCLIRAGDSKVSGKCLFVEKQSLKERFYFVPGNHSGIPSSMSCQNFVQLNCWERC